MISKDAATRRREMEKLRADFGILGQYLERDDCTDIVRNDDARTFVRFHGGGYEPIEDIGDFAAELVIRSVAGMLDKQVNYETPDVQGEFPLDGSRFQGVIPPVSRAPAFALRKPARRIIPLQHYVDSGVMPERVASAIQRAIRESKNILVIGGTGSGKTTLVNAVLAEIASTAPDDRVLVLEDTPELRPQSINRQILQSTPSHDLAHLLRLTLRLDPSRIVVGEVRGGEALALCNAWISGNPGGVATIHAGNCREGLTRMEQLISEKSAGRQPDLVGQAVNLTVYIDGSGSRRRVKEAAWVSGWDTERGYSIDYI